MKVILRTSQSLCAHSFFCTTSFAKCQAAWSNWIRKCFIRIFSFRERQDLLHRSTPLLTLRSNFEHRNSCIISLTCIQFNTGNLGSFPTNERCSRELTNDPNLSLSASVRLIAHRKWNVWTSSTQGGTFIHWKSHESDLFRANRLHL